VPVADVPVDELRGLLRELHGGASQEAAAARIALALWRRAKDEPSTREVEARLEALFDALAALEARGKALVRRAESGFSTDPRG
jgi:signal transduction histidine kinase